MQHDRLHAKVVMGPDRALIGSANLSSNGLNLEAAELEGWEEAGVILQEAEQIAAVRGWFDLLWTASYQISDDDLEEARQRWKLRRFSRVMSRSRAAGDGFTLLGLTRRDIQDRPVYLAIYREYSSDEARTALRKKLKTLTGLVAKSAGKLPPFYEAWPELPENAYLIDLYYGKRGALKCWGIFTRAFPLDFTYRDGTAGHLAVCRKESHVLGLRFSARHAAETADFLRQHIAAIWASQAGVGDETAKVIKLADALDICGHQTALAD